MSGRLFAILLVLVVFLSGCTVPEKIQVEEKSFVCNKPYIQVGGECCLDENSNSICDKDETPAKAPPLLREEEPEVHDEVAGPAISDLPTGSLSDEPTLTNETPEENVTLEVPTCEVPEILSGSTCCLDENYNGICDEEEGEESGPPISVTFMIPTPVCGDGLCQIGENQTTCPKDCGCPEGQVLSNNTCLTFVYVPDTSFSLMEICGNGVCKEGAETQETCCKDCGCPEGLICFKNNCTTITLAPPAPMVAMTVPTHDTYITALINEIIIHDDTDPFGPGEVMLLIYGASGEKVQEVQWPYRIWRTTASGQTIPQRIPIFSSKESEMGDKLAISITAIDNDQLPSWLEFFVDVFDFVTKPIQAILVVATSPIASVAEGELTFETSITDALGDALTGNEKIGSINKIYLNTSDWGVSDGEYAVKKGGFTVKYSIIRHEVPRDKKLVLKFYNVTFDETGDYYNGEVWLWTRLASGFGEKQLEQKVYRIPTRGTYSMPDGSRITSGSFITDSYGNTVEAPLITYESRGPFLYFELNGWDEDNPELGDDHDDLGKTSEVFFFHYFDLPPATSTVNYAQYWSYPWVLEGDNIMAPFKGNGNMKAYFEVSREPV